MKEEHGTMVDERIYTGERERERENRTRNVIAEWGECELSKNGEDA